MNIVYTAISGGYDLLRDHPPIRGCQFIAFVDNPHDCPKHGWEIHPLIPFCEDPTRNSKRYKVLAHEFLPHAEYSLYLDGSISVLQDLKMDDLIKTHLSDHDIALFRHNSRDCLYEEAGVCQQLRLDSTSVIDRQMSRYRSEGYPPHNGLTENGVILRRHTPAIAALNATWWKEICDGSRRDQLSLCYCLWKLNISYSVFPKNIRHSPLFKKKKHLLPHPTLLP